MILSIINIASIIGLITTIYFSVSYILELKEAQNDLVKVKSDMLQLRRNEKDFLARKDLKYRDKFNKNFNSLNVDIKLLNELLEHNGLDHDASSIKNLKEIVTSYKDIFIDITKIQENIGLDHKSGLYGKLRASVHSVQATIKSLNYSEALALTYELRKHEKDFMLRYDTKYISKFEKSFNNLIDLLKSSNSIDSNTKSNSINSLNNYKRDFLELTKAESIKGLNSKSGLLGKMRATIQKSEKSIAVLYKSIDEHIQESIDTLIYTLLVISIIMLIVIFASTSVISKKIIQQLKDSISTLAKSSKNIEHSSGNLNEGSHNLSNMAIEQSASVEELTATVEQILSNTSSNFTNMQELDTIGTNMKSNANIGYSHMIELKSSMESIADSSTKINTIVNTIDEISFQTNLLALNAAVEAARAGEHGLGFAVVSEEVRSLATRSTDEAKKIHSVIEKAVEQSKKGIVVANNTNESFESIVGNIDSTMKLIQKTKVSSNEQQDAIKQLRTSILEVDKVTQQLSVNSEEISGMAESLNKESISTNKIIQNII
jgi:methyl-accepting chemotaxis protein